MWMLPLIVAVGVVVGYVVSARQEKDEQQRMLTRAWRRHTGGW